MRAVLVVGLSALLTSTAIAQQDGDPSRGQQFFHPCLRRLSLAEAQHQHDRAELGRSVDRKAGTLQSFARYSPAMKSAQVIWVTRRSIHGSKTLRR